MHFEDFRTGTEYQLEPIAVTEDAIVKFATAFDPQRIHVDPEFSRNGPFGGLIASGYHTLAMVWRGWVDRDVLGEQSMGGPGLEHVKWLAPVRPGDVLHTTVTITGARRSKSRPRGIVSFHFSVRNQSGVEVMSYDTAAMVALFGERSAHQESGHERR